MNRRRTAVVLSCLLLTAGCGDTAGDNQTDAEPDAGRDVQGTTDTSEDPSAGDPAPDLDSAVSEDTVPNDPTGDPDDVSESEDQATTDAVDSPLQDPDLVEDPAVDAETGGFVFDGQCPGESRGGAIGFGPIDPQLGLLEIHVRNCEEIAGFQLDLIGIQVDGASGGHAAETFSALSTNNPPSIQGGRIVAFDMGGRVVSPTTGEDTLFATVTFTPLRDFTQVCLEGVVFSSPGAAPHRLAMEVGDCASLE